jgi:hypothetical protein
MNQLPPAARVERIEVTPGPVRGYADFGVA